MASSFMKRLLKIARAAVDMVTNQISQQLNTVTSQVQSPLQAMVNEIAGGAWVGDGADKFVEELTSLALPNTGRIMESCTTTLGSIQRSVEIIDRADTQVRGIVDDLDNTFRNIFRG